MTSPDAPKASGDFACASGGAAAPRATFPRRARVRARAEFTAVFEAGRRTAEPLMALHYLADDAPARLGLAVSRKVDPRAVGRNRIKRVLRDAFRGLRGGLAAGRYVVVARPAAAKATAAELREAFVRILQRSGTLQSGGVRAHGTMAVFQRSPE